MVHNNSPISKLDNDLLFDIRLRFVIAWLASHQISILINQQLIVTVYKEIIITWNQIQYRKILKIQMQTNQQGQLIHFDKLKAYLHRQKTTFAIKFSKWDPIQVSLIGKKIWISQLVSKEGETNNNIKQKNPSFDLAEYSEIKMSKKVSQLQKKFSFGIIFGQQKIIFGFDFEKTAQKVFQQLKQVSKKKHKNVQVNQTERYGQQNQNNHTGLQNNIIDKNYQSTQRKTGTQAFQNILNSQWFCDEGNSQFLNQMNFPCGSLLVHKSNKNLFKASLLIQNIRWDFEEQFKFKILCLVVDCYLNSNAWNSQIEQNYKICTLNANSFLLFTKIRKQSMVSYARQAVQLVILERDQSNHEINIYITNQTQFSQINQKVGSNYFQINDQEIYRKINDSTNQKNVKMDIKQKVRVRIDSLETFGILLFEIKSEMKFNGYNRSQDDAAMNSKYFQSLSRFSEILQNLLHSQLSSQGEFKCRQIQFLQQFFQSCRKQINSADKHQQSKLCQNSKANNQRELRQPLQKDNVDQLQDPTQQNEYSNYIKALRKIYNPPFSLTEAERLIKLINQKEHQKYYLKHHFQNQLINNKEKYRHSIKQPNHFVFQNGDWRFDENKQLYFDNQQMIQANKNVGKFLLKQFGSNLLKGQNIMSMSLPVQIFDDKSLLQRVAVGFGHVANYLTQAALIEDPLQQCKLVTTFLLAGPLLHIKNTKPFNPVIGQTFQCRVGGIPVFLQQISHHPPITAYFAKTQDMQVYGQAQSFVEFGFNAVHARNHKFLRINFPKTKTQYKGGQAQIEFSGMMLGKKYQRHNGIAFVHQKNSNYYSQWAFGKSKKNIYPKQFKEKMKRNDINGGIFKVAKQFGQSIWNQKNKVNFEGLNNQNTAKQVQKTLIWIHGRWTGDIYFDNKKIKQFDSPIPFRVQRLDYILPSDCNLRADVIYKRCGNNKKSQQAKQQLQNSQRRDRKLREKVK